ncbi:MAG: hypothetical protein ACE5KA_06885 [Nitrososphaerales archaeon]
MEDRHIIAVYCRYRDDYKIKNTGKYLQMFPEHVINRIKKASEVYKRVILSHADSEYTRLVFFGHKSVEPLKQYSRSIGLPAEKIDLDDCKDIATMAKKIWSRVENNNALPRVYFVVSNWQWIYLDPLTSIKDDRYKFYFEGAIDERHPDEIEMDKEMEKVARIERSESSLARILDKVGADLSENLKG